MILILEKHIQIIKLINLFGVKLKCRKNMINMQPNMDNYLNLNDFNNIINYNYI